MSWLHTRLTDTATHWVMSGMDVNGDPSFATPVAIFCRWEDRNVAFTNPEGEELASSAVAFTVVDVAVGDMLFHGTSTQADPHNEVGSRKVEGMSKIPELIGSSFERRAFLSARGRVR